MTSLQQYLGKLFKVQCMHYFIVYQYGKVGSSAVVDTLNTLPGAEACQVHFFDQKSFQNTFNRLLSPNLSDYMFHHSSGQLMQNIAAYRRFLRAGQEGEKTTILTMCRDPFDWFRSCVTQDIAEYLPSFHYTLHALGIPYEVDDEAVFHGLLTLFSRILQALELSGGIDNLTTEKRQALRKSMDFADNRDFQLFLFLLGRFLMPHNWFSTHLHPALDTNFTEMEAVSPCLFRTRKEWGNIYMLRYEQLAEAFGLALGDLGYAKIPELKATNVSASKRLNTAVREAFASDSALSLSRQCHSEASRLLGYGDTVLDKAPASAVSL